MSRSTMSSAAGALRALLAATVASTVVVSAVVVSAVVVSAVLVACEPEEEAEAPADGCTTDATCATDAYCDLTDGTCQVGCRNTASCPAGEVCDGNRVCVGENPDTGVFGDSCADDSGCNAPLVCAPLTGTCAEACTAGDACVACTAASAAACSCNAFGFCQP